MQSKESVAAEATINHLMQIIATRGLLRQIVTDCLW